MMHDMGFLSATKTPSLDLTKQPDVNCGDLYWLVGATRHASKLQL